MTATISRVNYESCTGGDEFAEWFQSKFNPIDGYDSHYYISKDELEAAMKKSPKAAKKFKDELTRMLKAMNYDAGEFSIW